MDEIIKSKDENGVTIYQIMIDDKLVLATWIDKQAAEVALIVERKRADKRKAKLDK